MKPKRKESVNVSSEGAHQVTTNIVKAATIRSSMRRNMVYPLQQGIMYHWCLSLRSFRTFCFPVHIIPYARGPIGHCTHGLF